MSLFLCLFHQVSRYDMCRKIRKVIFFFFGFFLFFSHLKSVGHSSVGQSDGLAQTISFTVELDSRTVGLSLGCFRFFASFSCELSLNVLFCVEMGLRHHVREDMSAFTSDSVQALNEPMIHFSDWTTGLDEKGQKLKWSKGEDALKVRRISRLLVGVLS